MQPAVSILTWGNVSTRLEGFHKFEMKQCVKEFRASDTGLVIYTDQTKLLKASFYRHSPLTTYK